MTGHSITYGFRSSHDKGGQHTNGPDYGVVTGECSVIGVKIEVQTASGFGPLRARALISALLGLAKQEMVR
jgi:hypothetical protein